MMYSTRWASWSVMVGKTDILDLFTASHCISFAAHEHITTLFPSYTVLCMYLDDDLSNTYSLLFLEKGKLILSFFEKCLK